MLKNVDKKIKINEQIKDQKIRLVMNNGEMKGEVSIFYALDIANNINLDLVEVSPSKEGSLAICKIMDYGKVKYQSSKKKKNKEQITKEIKFGLFISEHDLMTKHNKINIFLKKGFKVKYIMVLKGRKTFTTKEALDLFNKNLESFKDQAMWESPQVTNRFVMTILNSI